MPPNVAVYGSGCRASDRGCRYTQKLPIEVPERRCSSPESLYERLRLPRASRLQGMSETNKIRFHMPDGQAQKERDAEMASGATDWSWAAIAWLYEHDAELVEGS